MTPTFSRILVPTDFSAGSRLAVDYAVQLARRLGASIHILHVTEDPSIAGMWTEAYVDLAQIRMERETGARHLMDKLLRDIGPADVTDEIAAGPVARVITDAAADRDAGLIVMGTHGRTGLVHVLVGSVAEQVMRMAGCPVLTVREGLAADRVLAPAVAPGIPA
ncbi:MAG: universal stress protein [Acidobacteria bacterium]|nr:universal stress protein [Acidobacteriota bacterium]